MIIKTTVNEKYALINNTNLKIGMQSISIVIAL